MRKLKAKKEELEQYVQYETTELTEALSKKQDPLLIVLKFHLLIENYLERIILGKLKRGDRLLEKANLGFYQKLCLVDSFDIIDDSTIHALRHLNTIRNNFAHNKGKELSSADIELIGRPLGKKFTEVKRKHRKNLNGLTIDTFSLIYQTLLVEVAFLEFDTEEEKGLKGEETKRSK